MFNETRAKTKLINSHGVAVVHEGESRAPTAVECSTLVQLHAPEAQAAEYSNQGDIWCRAVYSVCVKRCRHLWPPYLYGRRICYTARVALSVVFYRSGIVYDTTRQTCVFERKVPRMEC